MVKLTDEEARDIEDGIPNLREPILITWIRKLLQDRRERIAEAKAVGTDKELRPKATPIPSRPPEQGNVLAMRDRARGLFRRIALG